MIAFFQALHSHFKALDKGAHNPFYDRVGGRFSYGEAKPGSSFPYAVFFGLPFSNEDTFQEEIDGCSIQVNIYASKRSEAMQAAQECRALFDGAVLTVSGYRDVTIRREMMTPPWKNGSDWVASVEFEALIQAEE